MTDGETKTAYEQFLEQAQEEVVHRERNDTGEFVGYRDIANDLFAIAKRESLPYLTNRFQFFSIALALILLALIGHGVIFLNVGSTLIAQILANPKIRGSLPSLVDLKALHRRHNETISRTNPNRNSSRSTAPLVRNGADFAKRSLRIGTIWIAVLRLLRCASKLAEENSDQSIFGTAAADATHNFSALEAAFAGERIRLFSLRRL